MKFDALKNRLLALEKKSGSRSMTLRFADGSTRALRVKDAFAFLIAVWERHYALIVGEPMPACAYDAEIALLGRADGLEGNSDPFLELLQQEAKKTKENIQ